MVSLLFFFFLSIITTNTGVYIWLPSTYIYRIVYSPSTGTHKKVINSFVVGYKDKLAYIHFPKHCLVDMMINMYSVSSALGLKINCSIVLLWRLLIVLSLIATFFCDLWYYDILKTVVYIIFSV